MFKENKRLAATDTLIGQGTLSEGQLICEASLRIEGEHRGTIECKGVVTIGECGLARSNINARDITIAGKVFGEVFSKGKLLITSSGVLNGNVKAQTLIIQDGGKLNGTCHMEMETEHSNGNSETSQTSSKESKAKDTKEKSRQAG